MKKLFLAAFFAALLGLASASAIEFYRQVMVSLEWFLFGQGGHLVPVAEELPLFTRAMSPIFGGVAAGIILWAYGKVGGRMPHAAKADDYLDAIRWEDGQFDAPMCGAKIVASLCVVASGSAIGREGSMILLAALLCSLMARHAAPQKEWKLWTACGVAAGMSAAYHAPLAGSLFIAEVFWGTFAVREIWPVLISAIASLFLAGYFQGGEGGPLYASNIKIAHGAGMYSAMLIVSLAAGMLGTLYLLAISHGKSLFKRLNPPLPLRLALGGAFAGILSVFYPQVWGNGYSVIENLLQATPAASLICGVFLCKLLAIIGCNGSGAPGGIFTPTLFIGASMGTLLSLGLAYFPFFTAGSQLMAATGMASMLAAVSHAPLMSALMACELTGEYALLPAFIVCALLADQVAHHLKRQSIYGNA